jgi:hypothetical protein
MFPIPDLQSVLVCPVPALHSHELDAAEETEGVQAGFGVRLQQPEKPAGGTGGPKVAQDVSGVLGQAETPLAELALAERPQNFTPCSCKVRPNKHVTIVTFCTTYLSADVSSTVKMQTNCFY